jgi:hypothetical protein
VHVVSSGHFDASVLSTLMVTSVSSFCRDASTSGAASSALCRVRACSQYCKCDAFVLSTHLSLV